MDAQIRALRAANIVIGTPGRVMDHMRRHTLRLDDLRTVVLDEADEMLNMGFLDDIQTILAETPDTRQTVLFSATIRRRSTSARVSAPSRRSSNFSTACRRRARWMRSISCFNIMIRNALSCSAIPRQWSTA